MSSVSTPDWASDLAQFTGTRVEDYHKYNALFNSVLSEGCHFVARNGGAFWLFELIDSHIMTKKELSEMDMIFSKLKKHESGSGCTVYMEDGNNNVIAEQTVPYTDFPLDNFQVWTGQTIHCHELWDDVWVHYLPSEH